MWEATDLRNTWGSRWPQIAICYTLGSIAARQPSHSAFLWLFMRLLRRQRPHSIVGDALRYHFENYFGGQFAYNCFLN